MGRLIEIQAVIIIYINTKIRLTECSILPESKVKSAIKSLSVCSQLQL